MFKRVTFHTIPDLYGDRPLRTRWHVQLRWRLFPFKSLLPLVPKRGPLVDLGCGYGHWTFCLAMARLADQVWGYDPDSDRIREANELAQKLGILNVHFCTGTAENADFPQCTLLSLIDVLYLLPYDAQTQLLARVQQRLRPGGVLLLKEMAEKPRWKWYWNYLEETLTVRLLGITIGQQFFFRKSTGWFNLLTNLGFEVEVIEMDRGYLHPHILFIGRQPLCQS